MTPKDTTFKKSLYIVPSQERKVFEKKFYKESDNLATKINDKIQHLLFGDRPYEKRKVSLEFKGGDYGSFLLATNADELKNILTNYSFRNQISELYGYMPALVKQDSNQDLPLKFMRSVRLACDYDIPVTLHKHNVTPFFDFVDIEDFDFTLRANSNLDRNFFLYDLKNDKKIPLLNDFLFRRNFYDKYVLSNIKYDSKGNIEDGITKIYENIDLDQLVSSIVDTYKRDGDDFLLACESRKIPATFFTDSNFFNKVSQAIRDKLKNNLSVTIGYDADPKLHDCEPFYDRIKFNFSFCKHEYK